MKLQRNKSSLLSIFLLLLLAGNLLFAQKIELKIIETTDVHGKIFPYDFKEGKYSNGSLAQVATYVDSMRKAQNDNIILLDNGDILQGTPAVYYYNFEKKDSGHLCADVMNYLKYDAATVGNHDIETGHDVYDRFTKELSFPWLAANAIDKKSGKPYFQPYKIIEKGKIKIAVLGLITPHIPHWLPEKIWEGMEFTDMIVVAKKWIKEIKEKENPDLIVGLFHAGVDYSYGNQKEDTEKNENATELIAKLVDGFNIVFAGHDHHGWNKKIKNKSGKEVLILGATSGARDVAVANVSLKYDEENKKFEKSMEGELINLKSVSPSKEFLNKFEKEFETIKKYVSRPIGNFSGEISSREALFGNSAFVDLIHRIQLELTNADVSFAAPLSFDSKIDSGKLFVKDMFKLYKYENLLYTMELTGKEIKDYLEYSYSNWFNEMKNENDHLLKFRIDKDGKIIYSERTKSPMLASAYYNFDSASGIEYIVDLSKPTGERVEIKRMSNGDEFEENRVYKVALNSYRGNGGGGHLIKGAGIEREKLAERIVSSTEKDLRFYMMKWIEKQNVVKPFVLKNWKIVPENYWEKGMKKDYKILFPN